MKLQYEKIVFFLLISGFSSVFSKEIVWSGNTALNTFADTHDVVGGVQDLYLLWPERKIFDAYGHDIHAVPKFNLTAIDSTLRCDMKGDKIADFDASAQIECQFVGASQFDISTFLMRQAYGLLKNERHEIIFGQTWHPIRPPECISPIVSFNDGAPFELYGLDPQFRYTYTKKSFQVLFAMLEQGQGYKSPGPEGFDSMYIRRAILPNLHAQIRSATDTHSVGLGVDYKQLVPRVVNKQCNSVSERVHNVSATAYWVQKFQKIDICTQFLYTQNAVDLQTIGGYVVTAEDPLSGARTYAPTQTINAWFDFNYRIKNNFFSTGFFAGVTKSLGTLSRICTFNACGRPITYGYTNIDFVVRVSPRLVWNLDRLRIGFEVEYTGASYGKLDDYARVRHGRYVDNVRVLLVMTYFF